MKMCVDLVEELKCIEVYLHFFYIYLTLCLIA